MTIVDVLEMNARTFQDDVALVEINPEMKEVKRLSWMEADLVEANPLHPYRREITWGVLDEKANRFANMLMSRGIKKGDKVAILLMNCIEWLPIYFGILKTGALAVPLNFRYASDEIEYCVNLAEADVLVFGPEFVERVQNIVDKIAPNRMLFYVGEGCPKYAESYNELTANCSSVAPRVRLDIYDDAAIYFSSGTTGFPKAILHNHESLIHSARCEQNHHGQTKDDVFLCIPPLYHTGAKMHWFGSLISGSKAVLLKGTKPEFIIKAASEEKCSIVWLLVPWAQDILEAIDNGTIKLEDYDLSAWRLMHIGAQPVPPSLIKHWKENFPEHQYDTNYGLSESIGPGCVHLGVENIDKVGAIGKAGFGWYTKLVDEKRNEIKKGEVGELAVKGPGVMKCYYNDEKATEEVLDDQGWLYTGDMAMEDEDGFIFLVDRKKDVIISGGENIYPVQIENFLRAGLEAIHDVAVIGIPDQRLGETTLAVIELKEGMSLTEDEVNEYAKNLPRYKRPHSIVFADIPRNPTGKIEKPKLREQYCGVRLVEAQNRG
ncbi:MAG: acyl--CoA ligase [Lachnospiraceae bacterium]|nr:acyl--CoA ligase [Lachnospiraceae bacterium]